MTDRGSLGVEGLDDILHGGLPRNRMYLVQGDPGVGKTTLALQFLLKGVADGEPGLYVTLSETEEELKSVAKSHGWSLDGLSLVDLSAIEEQLSTDSQTTLLHPAEMELSRTTKLILDHVERLAPARVVFDSLSELQLLAQSALRFRRQLLAFKQYFDKRRCTVLLLDDRTTGAGDMQVQSLTHGVITLEQLRPEFGAERRRLSVVKLRGSRFRGGHHDFDIETGGIRVYPRLVAAEHHADFVRDLAPSEVPQLDRLLAGGLQRGTSNLFLGPAGCGKSTIVTQYALACAGRGELTHYFLFDETEGTLLGRTESLGLDIRTHLKSGALKLRQLDPAEASPGEFVHMIRSSVETDKTRVIVLDSLNGFMQAMPEERFLVTQLHELLTYLNQQGVVTLMALAQHGLIGRMDAGVDLTYLADTVVLLRFFEAHGSVKKAISVIKKRSGGHEATIREMRIGPGGVQVGEPLVEFRGVLTGTPEFLGKNDLMIKE